MSQDSFFERAPPLSIEETHTLLEGWSSFYYQKEKLKKRRKMMIVVIIIGLFLHCIPVIIRESNKWTSLIYCRLLSEKLHYVRHLAVQHQQPYRLIFTDPYALVFRIGPVKDCLLKEEPPEVFEEGVLSLAQDYAIGSYFFSWVFESLLARKTRLVVSSEAHHYGLHQVIEEFCYDPYATRPALRSQAFVMLSHTSLDTDFTLASHYWSTLMLEHKNNALSFIMH